ncbi:MAG TPA: HEAT repeat domain-containing protein [Gemmatimonadales bacterium]|nr:HEAT repeat domain-containing protein [Gemmatimonadales bacterium]
MSTAEDVVATLAAALFLFRDRPGEAERQAEAFRALRAQLAARAGGALDLVVESGATGAGAAAAAGLTIGGEAVAPGAPGVAQLREQLRMHGVGEVHVAADATDAALLALLRALAAPRGTFRSLHELTESIHDAAGAGVRLRPAAPPPPGARPDGFQSAAMDAQLDPGAAPPTDLDAVLARLAADPADPALPQLLQTVVGAVDRAAAAGAWEEVLRLAVALVEAEAAAGGRTAGRDYPVALRRIFPRATLLAVARLVTDAPHRAAALLVLRRLGADATDALLGFLADADTMDARRSYYNALREMTEGTTLFVAMLARDEWYVVRNVADLCGDLRLEAAVPALARQVAHPDERVRRAVAGALAKIGTPATIEPLGQALRDPALAVRLQAVRGLEGWRARGLAMPLSLRLDEESDPELQREILFALSRIATPEAVQALARIAAPGGRVFHRKPVALRLQAVEALAAAGTAQSAAALQALLTDADAEVRAAARRGVGL